MAKKGNLVTQTPESYWRRNQSFTFGGKGGLPIPEGFETLDLDQEVTVILTGKVTSLRKDKEDCSIGMECSKAEITVKPEDEDSLKGAFAATKKKV